MEQNFSGEKFLIFASSYTHGFFAKDVKGDGLSTFLFDTQTKKIQLQSVFSEVPNLSFLSFSPSENIIYGASEMENGAFVTLQQSKEDFKLVNSFETKGKDSCHICVNKKNGIAIVTNYSSGSFSLFLLDHSSGNITEKIQTIDLPFSETGPVVDRQEMAHAHCSEFHENSNTLYISDLGGDKIHIFKFDPIEHKVNPFKDQPFFKVEPGFGPRHLCLSANGKFLYSLNELKPEIWVFSVGEDGSLGMVQRIKTIFENNLKENYNAEIKIHQNQKFLLSSNRGYDLISLYKIDEKNGELSFLRHQNTFG